MGTSTPAAISAGSNATPSPLAHALSGAVGAVVAMALLYPLDQVRAILQIDDELAEECSGPRGAGIIGALSRIVRRHGRAALWRGMIPVLITMGVSNFVYFYCFNGMKAALLARRRIVNVRRSSAPAAGIERSVSAALAAAAMNAPPTALTSPSASSAAEHGARLDSKSAAASFRAGVGAGAGGGRDDFVIGLTTIESTVASTVAGVINVLATTPLWVSNLRIKAGRGVGGLFSTLAAIGRTEGLSGLWSGAAPSLVLVSNPIIQFVVYEALKQAAGNRHYRRHQQIVESAAAGAAATAATTVRGGDGGGAKPGGGLPSHEAFLLGATAKACSTLVTYPLQLAQAKLRAGPAQGQNRWQSQCKRNGEDESTTKTASSLGKWRTSMVWQVLTCWSSTVDVLVSVCRENGVSGMYQGMHAKLLHTVLTSALMFLGYERLVQIVANAMAGRSTASGSPSRPGSAAASVSASSGRMDVGYIAKKVA